MTSREFCYWLNGYLELQPGEGFTVTQTQIIRRHLAMVFRHEIDPSLGDAAHVAALQDIHDGPLPDDIKGLLQELRKRVADLEARPIGGGIDRDTRLTC